LGAIVQTRNRVRFPQVVTSYCIRQLTMNFRNGKMTRFALFKAEWHSGLRSRIWTTWGTMKIVSIVSTGCLESVDDIKQIPDDDFDKLVGGHDGGKPDIERGAVGRAPIESPFLAVPPPHKITGYFGP
jgi:hypothetical protein